jgi:hypothetical protein
MTSRNKPRRYKMWDPISVMFCMWILNVGLPDARLKVSDAIEDKEHRIIVDTIKNSVTIRDS